MSSLPNSLWQKLQKYADSLLLFFSMVCLAYFAWGWLQAWAVEYSSDHALIGLIADSILKRGERPIFVWQVGYQGMFLEGYLTAFFFKIFGTHPMTLSLAPALYFTLSLPLFHRIIRLLFDRQVATLAVLLLVFSGHVLYEICFRALPNFSSVFLMGMILFNLYHYVFYRLYIQNIWDRKLLVAVFLLGLVSGFALYTFVISALFVLTYLGVSAFLFLFNLNDWSGHHTLKALFWPAGAFRKPTWSRACVAGLTTICFILISFGLSTLALGTQFDFVLVKGRRPVEPLHLLLAGIFLWILVCFGAWFTQFQTRKKQRFFGSAIWVLGLLIGFSPSLYYWFMLGGKSARGASVSGNLELIGKRLGILWDGLLQLLNLDLQQYYFSPVFYIFLASVIYFTGLVARNLQRVFRNRSLRDLNRGSLFWLLPLVVCCAFILSRHTVDFGSARYLSILIYPVALVYSCFLLWLWRMSLWGRAYSLICTVVLLGSGAQAITAPWSQQDQEQKNLDEIVAELDARGIERAYADYWLAYWISFYTHDRIQIEPTYTAYSPHYREMIQAEQRIAYIVRLPDRLARDKETLAIGPITYRIASSPEIISDRWELTWLEKVNP